jgi:PilZ domain-containing protein
MSEDTKVLSKGSDWTRLLTDPDLVSHLGKLLQTYRDVSPERRETALLQAMREIKDAAIKVREERATVPKKEPENLHSPEPFPAAPAPSDVAPSIPAPSDSALSDSALSDQSPSAAPVSAASTPAPSPVPPADFPRPQPMEQRPPFEPDVVTAEAGRRRFQRIKCYAAVEIHIEGQEAPVWGNLANVSRGGCLVETASAVPAGKILEIGLWVASGKIWVKGVILSGIATRSASFGVRVKFSESELSEKEHLREFLKFVENSARKAQSGNAYVTQLKS